MIKLTSPILNTMRIIFSLGNMRTASILLILLLISISSYALSGPLWQSSLFIQARSQDIIITTQKVSGFYTYHIAFASTRYSPIIALALPQIRWAAIGYIDFKMIHSGLTNTGFTIELTIGSSTTIWYLIARYIAFSQAYLPTQFQTYLFDSKSGTTIGTAGSTYRTNTIPITLSPSAAIAGSPNCAAFLSGVKAASADQYQFNITCIIVDGNNANVIGTAYPSTVIQTFTFYLIVWDTNNLAIQSFYFVDYTLTTISYNTQKTFVNFPQGYFDLGYIGGLCSFSYTNNQQFTLSLTSRLLYSSLTSFYNSVPQFQVRYRLCDPTNAPYYNIGDQLCYPICPTTNYQNSTNLICYPCGVNCLTCVNATICTICASSYIISSGACVCTANSYSANGVCIGCHYSCLTCAASGQYYNCLTCNTSTYRVPVAYSGFNFMCVCNSNTTDVGIEMCADKCGDGINITSGCDDGNINNLDGCSSTCQVELNFNCTLNTNNVSVCYYMGKLTLTLVKVLKQDRANLFRAYFQVSPWISTMTALASPNSLTSNASSNTATYDTYQNYIVYQLQYDQSLQNTYVRFDLKPTLSGIFSKIPPTNITVLLKADNAYLLQTYSEQQYAAGQTLFYFSYIIGFLMLGTTFIFIFGRLKWIGNLLFFSLQFQYISTVIIPKYNPILHGLAQMKPILGYNEALGIEEFDLPKYPAFTVLNFNKQYDYNVNVMVAIQAFSLVMYIIYHVTYRKNQILCKKYGGEPEKTYKSKKMGKILSFFDWELFMFWALFNMTQQIVAMVFWTQLPQPQFLPLIIFNVFCIIGGVAPLIFKRKNVKSYTQLLYYPDHGHQQSLITFGSIILMYTFLGFALAISSVLYYALYIIPICMIFYLFCRKPFQSRWLRAAYLINWICIIMTLTYNIIIIQLERDAFYLPVGIFVIIIFDWIFNLVVWGREAYVLCKYGGERGLQEIANSHTKTSTKDDGMEMFFKDGTGNQSFLNGIIKKNNQKFLDQGQTTKRPIRSKKVNLQDLPQGLRQKRQEAIDKQVKQQRQDLQKKRQKWAKQMKQMKQIKVLRQRTKHQIQKQRANQQKKSRMITTNSKGVDESRMQQLQYQEGFH